MEVDAEIDSRFCLLFLLFLPTFFVYTFVIDKRKIKYYEGI